MYVFIPVLMSLPLGAMGWSVICDCGNAVTSEIFLRVLFSRGFVYAKFPENKILSKWQDHSVIY